MPGEPVINIAVEGDVDEEVLRRLIDQVGGSVAKVYGKEGDNFIEDRLAGYNDSARRMPWCVLVDLNHKADCAPSLREDWLPGEAATKLCFRIAVREIEAWLMADPVALARYLAASEDHIPPDVESVDHPKQRMVAIARASEQRVIREDMVPRDSSGRTVGPAYTGRLMEFARDHWQPQQAAKNSDSLARAIDCLEALGDT